MFSHSCIRKFFASWLCGMLLLLGVGSADAANPQGKLESYGTLPNMLRVIGWAYDQDDMNHKTRVHVYVGGTAGSNVPSFEIRADKNHKQYPGHGFDQTVKIPTEWCGKRTIHVYALNDVGSGAFQEIGSLVVDIPAPKEQGQSARTGTVKGDVNNDGKVDDADLQLLERYHLGLVTSLPNKDAADMNGDGKISLIDISRLQTIVQQTQPKAVMLKDGWYQIAPSHDLGRVLDVWGLSKENGANLTVHSINGGNNQKFYLQNRGNGYFSLKAGHCDLYVTAEGRSAGANLVMRGWNGSDVQLFKLISGGNGIHHIVAKVDANLNFDCAGGQKQDGNNVQLWTKENNSAWHKWKFTSTSAPAPIVTNHNPQGGVSQIDSPGDYTLHVKGKAFDEDNLNGNVRVHVYVGGTAGANPNEVPQFELRAANQGGGFVFEGTQNIGNKKTGNQTVHVYALNDYGAGSFQEIWSGNVNIKPEHIQPELRYPLNDIYVCGNDWMTKYAKRPSRPYHAGIDVASSSGDKTIYAAAAGTVVGAGWNNANGNFVILQHTISGRTVYSFYCHMSKYLVSKGNNVDCGTPIGIIGNTGSASAGTHLHFTFVDRLMSSGGYWGYVTSTGNAVSYQGYTFYSPAYVIDHKELP